MNNDKRITVTNSSGLVVAEISNDKVSTCAGYNVDISYYTDLSTVGKRLKALMII